MTQIWLTQPMSNFLFLGGMVYSLRVTSNKFCRLQVGSGGLDCCVGVHPWWVIPCCHSHIGRWLTWKWVCPGSYGGSHQATGTYALECDGLGQSWRLWIWLRLGLGGLWLWIVSDCSHDSAFSSPCSSVSMTHNHRSIENRPKRRTSGFWVTVQSPVSRIYTWVCHSATKPALFSCQYRSLTVHLQRANHPNKWI